jgi:hypothetical protein
MQEDTRTKKTTKTLSLKTDEVELDEYKSSDWFLQIALIVAVTILVLTCIIGVGKRNAAMQDKEWRPYTFPMHQHQLYYGPQ